MGRVTTRSQSTRQPSLFANKESVKATTSGKVRKRKMVDKESVTKKLDVSLLSLSLDEETITVSSDVNNSNSDVSDHEGPDCSICLQEALHPVKLPCNHIFCYLCIKGLVHNSVGKCALCRAPVPRGFVLNPNVVEEVKSVQDDQFCWFYEGRSGGWWQYDVRTSLDIEEKHQSGETSLELMIAGFIYIIDLEKMVQKRKTAQHIQRRIKRDKDIPDRKGVAGLKSAPSTSRSNR